MNIEISKVKIKINEKEFDLSVDEAKELKKILMETFPDPITINPINPITIQPIYIQEQWQRPHYPYEFWCGTNSGNTLCLNATTKL